MGMSPEEILSIHKDYADQFASLAQSGLAGAFSALSGSGIFNYTPTGISITMPSIGEPRNVGPLPVPPADPTLPELVDLKDFLEVPNPDYGSAPQNTLGSGPSYAAPPLPSQVAPPFTATAPRDPDDPLMPSVPDYLALPDLNLPYPAVSVPSAPTITDPSFDGVRPANISMPDVEVIVGKYTTEMDTHRSAVATFARENAATILTRFAPEYETIRTRVNNAVTTYLHPTTGGGAGIPDTIEAAIHARASDRNMQEFQRALDTAADTLAKRGHTLPAGALLSAVRQARTAMGDAQVRSSTEIATKNLELEQQNFQFMMKLGEALEEKMLEMATQYVQLSLQMDAQAIASAKEIVATYLGAYNLQVVVYKALWDGYQAAVEVYKARIAANESLVRVYEAEIKAELAKTEVNKAHVEVLNAVAGVNRALADSYKAEVEAALAPLEVARIRLAVFEGRVRAHASEVAAFEARWRAYTSQVEGALAPFKAYEAQAQGYTAQAAAYRASVEGYSAQVAGIGEGNRTINSYNTAILSKFTQETEAKLKAFDKLIAAYSAESGVVLKQSDIEVEYWRTKANIIFQEFNVSVNQMFEYAREQMNLFRGQMEAAVSAGNGLAHAAQVAGNLAGGAMQGLTSFAGILESKEG